MRKPKFARRLARWWQLKWKRPAAPRKVPNKVPHTFDAQVTKLQDRGMSIPVADELSTKHHLAHINYYRLRGYWMPMEDACATQGEHAFKPGTTFSQVIDLYSFDRKLRLEINDAIERIEVSLRTQWAYVLATHHGTIAHREAIAFDDRKHGELIERLEHHYTTRNEIFLKHYLNRNEEPPIWVMCEILSMGDLSRWMAAILQRQVRQEIANAYDLDESVLISFAQHLAYVRNVCAHHGRLWNRDLTKRARLPKQPAALGRQLNRADQNAARIYNTLVLLAWMMKRVSPGSGWIQRTRALVESQPPAQWGAMGFPVGWQALPIWQ
ncbi:MAG: Abi family protein [Stenotrophomonas sp.]